MTKALIVQNNLDLMSLGNVLAKSGFFADSKDEAQAVVKVLAGQELGFGPVASMTGINIIKGRVTLSANLMAAAIKRSGKYTYRIREHTDQVCKIEFFESGETLGVSEFSMTDAQKAKLADGDNWKKFPRNMLFARALSNGAKFHCPDIFGGPIYTPDELGADIDGETGEFINGDYTVTIDEPAPEPPAELVQSGQTPRNGSSAVDSTETNKTPEKGKNKRQKTDHGAALQGEISGTIDFDMDDPRADSLERAQQFPTIRQYWPNLTTSILNKHVSQLPDGVSIEFLTYGEDDCIIKRLGYESSAEVKRKCNVESSTQFDGTVEEWLNTVLIHSAIGEPTEL